MTGQPVVPFCPPDGPLPPLGAFWWLQQNYADVVAAQEFMRELLADLLAKDPSVLTDLLPPMGVTDGSDAKPGQIGEFMMLRAPDIAFAPVQDFLATAIAGILPAGDWMAQCYAYIDTAVTGAQFYLDPQLPGVSDSMGAVIALGAGSTENITLVGPLVRVSFAAPQALQFRCDINNLGPGVDPGVMSVRVNAWRVR